MYKRQAYNFKIRTFYYGNLFEIKYSQVGPQFNSLANPFLTKNIREFVVSDRVRFFDNKLLDEENLLKLLNHASNNDFNALRDEALMGNKIKTNKTGAIPTREAAIISFHLTL